MFSEYYEANFAGRAFWLSGVALILNEVALIPPILFDFFISGSVAADFPYNNFQVSHYHLLQIFDLTFFQLEGL